MHTKTNFVYTIIFVRTKIFSMHTNVCTSRTPTLDSNLSLQLQYNRAPLEVVNLLTHRNMC